MKTCATVPNIVDDCAISGTGGPASSYRYLHGLPHVTSATPQRFRFQAAILLIKCKGNLRNEQQINRVPAGVQPEVIDMYTGCRMSPSPLCSGLNFNMPFHIQTQRKFTKMNTTLARPSPSQAWQKSPQVIDIYTGCRMSRSPLRSDFTRRWPSD